MNQPFSFLNNLGQALANYFSPATRTVGNVLDTLIPREKPYAIASEPVPSIPKPRLPTQNTISQGFQNFSPNVPVATAAGNFAQASNLLPRNIDPLLPAVLALMETGGGMAQRGVNNPFNIRGIQGGGTNFISYPDILTALLGGTNRGDISQGLVGLINNSPYYQDFRNSGNLADFFNVFTPPGRAYGNPSLDELLGRYSDLRSLFPSF